VGGRRTRSDLSDLLREPFSPGRARSSKRRCKGVAVPVYYRIQALSTLDSSLITPRPPFSPLEGHRFGRCAPRRRGGCRRSFRERPASASGSDIGCLHGSAYQQRETSSPPARNGRCPGRPRVGICLSSGEVSGRSVTTRNRLTLHLSDHELLVEAFGASEQEKFGGSARQELVGEPSEPACG
jgi:hypothetical protein